jgi:hypothetical protein
MSYFESGRYAGFLEGWKKDPESNGGPPDGVVSRKHLMIFLFDVVSFVFMDYFGLFSDSRPSS